MSTVLVVPGPEESAVTSALVGYDIRICETTTDVMVAAKTTAAKAIIFTGTLPDFDRETQSVLLDNAITILAFPQCLPEGFSAITVTDIADVQRELHDECRGDHLESNGRIIAVWGPLGSPGRTTLAINLAAEWPEDSVLVIDADSYGPSLGQHLNVLDDVSGVLAAARAANQGKLHTLGDFTVSIDQHWSILTGLPRPDLWRNVRPRAWDDVLERAVKEFETVVIDVGFCFENDQVDVDFSHRNHMTIAALARSQTIVAVAGSDPISLARLVRSLDELEQLSPDVPISIVLNGHDSSFGFSQREVMRTVTALTKRTPMALLPYDLAARQSAARGSTLAEVAPRSALRSGIAKLAAIL